MEYEGRYDFFDFARVRTYPIAERPNTLTAGELVWPDQVRGRTWLSMW